MSARCYACGGRVGANGMAEGGEVEEDGYAEGVAEPCDDGQKKQRVAEWQEEEEAEHAMRKGQLSSFVDAVRRRQRGA